MLKSRIFRGLHLIGGFTLLASIIIIQVTILVVIIVVWIRGWDAT